MKCAVANCKQSNSKRTTVSFYSFPKEEVRRKLWVIFCKRVKPVNADRETICALHFTKEDFERNLKFEMGFSKRRAKILKPHAVPSIHPGVIKSVEKTTNDTEVANGYEILSETEDQDVFPNNIKEEFIVENSPTNFKENSLQTCIKNFKMVPSVQACAIASENKTANETEVANLDEMLCETEKQDGFANSIKEEFIAENSRSPTNFNENGLQTYLKSLEMVSSIQTSVITSETDVGNLYGMVGETGKQVSSTPNNFTEEWIDESEAKVGIPNSIEEEFVAENVPSPTDFEECGLQNYIKTLEMVPSTQASGAITSEKETANETEIANLYEILCETEKPDCFPDNIKEEFIEDNSPSHTIFKEQWIAETEKPIGIADNIKEEFVFENVPSQIGFKKDGLQTYIETLEMKVDSLLKESCVLKKERKMCDITIKKLSCRIQKLSFAKADLEKALRRLFTEGQIKKLRSGDKRQLFSESDIAHSITLYSAGAKAYDLLRKQHFPLPSVRTLQRWMRKQKVLSNDREKLIK